jgi:hypothetical protein
MSTPAALLNLYFKGLSLVKGKNLKIVSKRQEETSGVFCTYVALLHTGTKMPTVLIVLVKAPSSSNTALFETLDYTEVHVRSYKTWEEPAKLGLDLTDLEEQSPNTLDTNSLENFVIYSVDETKTSKKYSFENDSWGSLTLFTEKPRINFSSNDLPLRARMIGWMRDHNFVYTK